MTIQTINIGTTPNDNTGDDPRTAGQKLNSNFTTSTHAASRDVGTASGNIPDADDLNMVGNTNYTSGNLNPNVFGGGSAQVITECFARDSVRMRFILNHSIIGTGQSVSVSGTFAVVDTSFNPVRAAIPASDVTIIHSNRKSMYMNINNMSGLTLDKPYLLLSEGTSTITVNP